MDSSNRSATVACLLPAGPSALIRLKHAVSEGFTRFKWKVGVADVDTELEVLRKMRAKLPKGALLRLDANGAWDRSIAEGWITACEGAPIEFIEQPFPAGADNLLMEFGSAHPGLFALDESVTPPGALHQWLERGWPGVVVVKPSLCGEPKRLRRLLVESGADVVFSTALETTFGWHSARRFALGHPNAKRALGFGAGQMFKSTSLSPDAAKPMVQTGETDRAHEEIWRQLAP